jgi:mannose-6-phosphate isomerase-like protein (cupin superfamily)
VHQLHICAPRSPIIHSQTDRLVVRGPQDGEHLWFATNRITVKAATEDTGGRFSLCEVVIAPQTGPPLHIHHHEDETFYVLEGEVIFRCGDREFIAGTGTMVLLPQGVPHGFFNPGDEPVRMLNLMAPGGGEGYFRDTGRPAEYEGLPPAGPIDPAVYIEHGPRYGAEVVGPPIRMPAAVAAV